MKLPHKKIVYCNVVGPIKELCQHSIRTRRDPLPLSPNWRFKENFDVALARLVCGMVAWSFPLPLLLFPNSSSGLQPLSASLLFPNTPELLIGFVLMYTVQNHPSPGMDKGVVHIYNRMLLSH